MKNYVYILFNKLSNRYESVMSFQSDSMALHRMSQHVDQKEYELCRVGSYDIETGIIEPCPVVRLIWEKPDYIGKMPTKEV